jgi:hypothetical protein
LELLVDRYAVDFPSDAVGLPLDLVEMEVPGSIEAKLNLGWRAAIAVLELRAVRAGVVEDVAAGHLLPR